MSWNKLTSLRTRTKDTVLSLAFSKDDSILAVGHFCGALNIFDAHTFAKIHELNLTNVDLKKNLSTHKKHQNTDEENEGEQQQQQHASSILADKATANHDEERSKLPVTALSFRPRPSPALTTSKAAQQKNVLLACCSNGQWLTIDTASAEAVLQDKEERDNEIYCCDWNSDGSCFATAGRDSFVRVYDYASGACTKRFTIQSPGSGVAPLRIYSLVFHPQDPHLVYAGGWSQSVTVFDLRAKDGYVEPARRNDLFGPVLMGDALCLVPRCAHSNNNAGVGVTDESSSSTAFLTSTTATGHETGSSGAKSTSTSTIGFDIFTASHRMEHRLELFDAATMTRIAEIPWPSTTQQFLPLCCAASPDGSYLAFGGGGAMDDGAFVIKTPSLQSRNDAAKGAAEWKVAHNITPGHQPSNDTTTPFMIKFENDKVLDPSQVCLQHVQQQQQQQQVQNAAVGASNNNTTNSKSHPIVAMRFSNGGKLLAICDSDGVTHIFDLLKSK